MRINGILSILLITTVCVTVWLAFLLANSNSNLEACAIEEMFFHEERDFLMNLPSMLHSVSNQKSLLKLLKEKYPNVGVERRDNNICFGALLLKFGTETDLMSIQQDCDHEK